MLQLLILWLAFGTSYAGSTELQNCSPCAEGAEEACARNSADQAGITGEEALARLIYAEALSTGYWKGRCEAPGGDSALFESIAWGVLNRAGTPPASGSKIKDIVFARSQFRTSFSRARNNPFATAFLCPLRANAYLSSAQAGLPRDASALYQNAEAIARRVLSSFNQSGLPANRRNISNFFYPKSEHFGEMRPTWAPNANATVNRGYFPIMGANNPCVEFYCLSRPCSATSAGAQPAPAGAGQAGGRANQTPGR